MKIDKYKKLAKIIIVLIILLLCIMYFVVPKISQNPQIFKEEEEGISTGGVSFNKNSYSSSGKMIHDYVNPSLNDKLVAEQLYGMNMYDFRDNGLFVPGVMDTDYEYDRFFTDIWIDNEFTNRLQKPNTENFVIEIGNDYLKITAYDMTEKDIKNYIKEISDEFDTDLYSKYSDNIFRAYNSNREIVDIVYYNEQNRAIISYEDLG